MQPSVQQAQVQSSIQQVQAKPSEQMQSPSAAPDNIAKQTWTNTVLKGITRSEDPSLFSLITDSEAFVQNNTFYIVLLGDTKSHITRLSSQDNLRKIRKFINDELKNTYGIKIITEDKKLIMQNLSNATANQNGVDSINNGESAHQKIDDLARRLSDLNIPTRIL
jgi:hypothetical protein